MGSVDYFSAVQSCTLLMLIAFSVHAFITFMFVDAFHLLLPFLFISVSFS
jgi:hypothetical protein